MQVDSAYWKQKTRWKENSPLLKEADFANNQITTQTTKFNTETFKTNLSNLFIRFWFCCSAVRFAWNVATCRMTTISFHRKTKEMYEYKITQGQSKIHMIANRKITVIFSTRHNNSLDKKITSYPILWNLRKALSIFTMCIKSLF